MKGWGDGLIRDVLAVQHKSMSLDLQQPHRKPGTTVCVCNPNTREVERGSFIPEAHWPVSLANQAPGTRERDPVANPNIRSN